MCCLTFSDQFVRGLWLWMQTLNSVGCRARSCLTPAPETAQPSQTQPSQTQLRSTARSHMTWGSAWTCTRGVSRGVCKVKAPELSWAFMSRGLVEFAAGSRQLCRPSEAMLRSVSSLYLLLVLRAVAAAEEVTCSNALQLFNTRGASDASGICFGEF